MKLLFSFLIPVLMFMYGCSEPNLDVKPDAPEIVLDEGSDELVSRDDCTACPNNFSIILRARRDASAPNTSTSCVCLGAGTSITSYMQYDTPTGPKQVKFQNLGTFGNGLYAAYGGFNEVCEGSTISINLCTIGGDNCSLDCLEFEIRGTAQGSTVVEYEELCAETDANGCVSFDIGTFSCCIPSTNYCQITFDANFDSNLTPCDNCNTSYCN